MHIHTKFRRRLLGSSALVAGAFFMATSGAQAASAGSCDGGPFTDGVTITCSGNTDDTIYGSGSNSTVTLSASSTLSGDTYVGVSSGRVLDTNGDHNTVTFGAGSVAHAYDDNKAVNFDGSNNTMTLNGASEITLDLGNQSSGTALDIDGDSNALTLNGGSSISVYGDTDNDSAHTFAVNIYGANNTVVLNGGSSFSLDVHNEKKYGQSTALFLGGENNIVTLNSSSITVEAYNHDKYNVTNDFSRTIGADISGINSKLTLNGSSLISVDANSDEKYSDVYGVRLWGDNTTLVLNDTSVIDVRASNSDLFSETYGVRQYGDGSTLTLNGASQIQVHAYAEGLSTAKGVDLDGDNAKFTLNGTSSVTVYAGSNGGSSDFFGVTVEGEKPTVVLNGTSSINLIATGEASDEFTGLSVSELSRDVTNVGSITLNGGSSVNVTLNGEGGVGATGVVLGGDHRRVRSIYPKYAPSLTLNGTSHIKVTGSGNEDSRYSGVIANAKYANITLNDNSSIQVYAEDSNDEARGIVVYGDNATITLNDHAAINVGNEYTEDATGILLSTSGSNLVLNDDAEIGVTANGYATGVAIDGSGNTLTLNDRSHIVSSDTGVKVDEGSYNSIELNDDSAIMSNYGPAVVLSNQYASTLTLNDNAVIGSVYDDGIIVDISEGTTITLNGKSRVIATNGAGIRVSGEELRHNDDYNADYYYHNEDVTINVGKDAAVSGTTGIVVMDHAQFTTVNVSGLVIGTDGTAIDFSQAYNSTLHLSTGAVLAGDIIGGSGYDQLILSGHGLLNNAVTNFDHLTVTGEKDDIWKLASNLDLDGGNVDIQSGQLSVNGILDAGTVYVDEGGTLGGSGTINGNLVVYGTVSPGNSPGTLNVVGNVNFTPGSGFKVQVEGTTADLLNVTGGAVTIDPGTSITMEFLGGVDGFVGDVIVSPTPVIGTFTTFIGGVFDYSTPGIVSLTSASPASVNTGMSGSTTVGFTFLDAVIDNAENGVGRSKGMWGTGLYNQTNRTGMGTTKGADVQGSGIAMGGDVFSGDGLNIGLAGGYIDSTATTEGGGSETGIKGYNVAAYTSYGMGNTFLTAAVTGAYQEQDVSRRVLVLGIVSTANASPDAWTAGAGVSLGHVIPVQGSWTLTPRASVGWQHVARDGYSETGGGTAAMSLQDVSADTMRGQVGAELGFTVKDPNAIWSVRPSIRAALAKELRSGDSTVNGRFLATGAAFAGKTDDRDQTYAAIGAGVDAVIGQGLTAFVQYDGAVGGDYEKSGGVRVGARFEW